MERIDEATRVIGTMIMEVSKDVFVADPGGQALTPEELKGKEQAAARQAVATRIGTLDEAFLMTLGGFVRAAADEGDAGMHERLKLLYEEVVAAVRSRLPPEVQLLDQLVGLPSSDERTALLNSWLAGAGKENPQVDMSRLDIAASQFIEDMEDKTEVPDRRLLARVCLVREEVQNAARKDAFTAGRVWSPTDDKSAQLRGGVSRRAVAFLQAVMKVGTSKGRLAYLRKAFTSDWEGAAPQRSGGATSSPASGGGKKSDAVRPGRFLTALGTTQAEMTGERGSSVPDGVLQRLEEVRREALQVLMEMAEPPAR